MAVSEPTTHSVSKATVDFLHHRHGLLIGGDWSAPRAGGELEVIDPATAQPIAIVAAATAADVDDAVLAARHAFERGAWPSLSGAARARLIWALADRILADRQLLSELETLDNGKPLADTRATLAEWELAAMALELQVNDQDQIGYVAPTWLGAPQIALAARPQHLSIFGMKPIKDAYLLMGQSMNAGHATACAGDLESVMTLPNDRDYLRAIGWIFNSKPVRAPAAIYLVNASNHIIGVGLIGLAREDVARVQGKKALYSGFQAYLLSKDKDQKFSVISPTEHCVLSPPA